jgi:hypothetical protein
MQIPLSYSQFPIVSTPQVPLSHSQNPTASSPQVPLSHSQNPTASSPRYPAMSYAKMANVFAPTPQPLFGFPSQPTITNASNPSPGPSVWLGTMMRWIPATLKRIMTPSPMIRMNI